MSDRNGKMGDMNLGTAMAVATGLCSKDADPTPYIVLCDLEEVATAQAVWSCEKVRGVQMDVLPDTRSRGRRAVLLFSRVGDPASNPQSAIRNPQSDDPQSGGA